MEAKVMVRDKSLRDIWIAADQSTIDVMQDKGNPPRNGISNSKQNHFPQSRRAKETSCAPASFEKEDIRGLFQHDVDRFEDDSVSLYSIWTPTNNDNLKNETKRSYKSPLIDLDAAENSKSGYRNVYDASSEDYTSGAFESPLIDLGTSENFNSDHRNISEDYTWQKPLIDLDISDNFNSKHTYTHTLPKCYSTQTYEKPLIDLKISENSNPRYRNNSTAIDNCARENIERRNLDGKLNNDNISEKSLDDLNEETFGKFSYATNEPELTLADISEATAACNFSKDMITNENENTKISEKPRVFNYSKSLKDVVEIQETSTGARPKTIVTKIYQQNNLQHFRENSNRKNPNGKKKTHGDSFSNLSRMTSNTDEILSLSRENLFIQKARRPIPGKFFPNKQCRMATRTRETFHSKGDTSYYVTEKITYVRGEKLVNANKKLHNDNQENNIVWKNDIYDLGIIADEKKNSGTKIKKHFQNNSRPRNEIKNKRLDCPNKQINYETYKREMEYNRVQTENQNNPKWQEQKHYKSKNQNTSSRSGNENLYQNENLRNSSADESTAKCLWKSDNLNQFNFDEPIKVSQDKTAHEKGQTQMAVTEQKHSVTHFRVYDPKLHRSTKKKIEIKQYMHHTEHKNNFFNKLQSEETGIKFTAENYPTKDLKEQSEFSDNFNLNKADKENKTFDKDVLKGIKLSDKCSSPDTEKNSITENNGKEHLKSSLIRDGKEIAELIVGCERALDVFKSFYCEWIELRRQSISLLEQIVQITHQSSQKHNTMNHVIAAINIAAGVANFIPHPGVAVGVKVAGAVGGFFANLIKRKDNDFKKDVEAKKYEIREIFQRDIDSSSYVYIYGVQCGSQFQETCNVIKRFHKQLLEGHYQSVINNDDVLEFMNELSEYNNSNTEAFYKKLQACYERLLENSNSEDSRAFVRVFQDVPDAVSVVHLLPWNFDSDGFDNSIVQQAWDELFFLFQDGNAAALDIIKDKVQNCLFFLKKEHRLLSRNLVHLFKDIKITQL